MDATSAGRWSNRFARIIHRARWLICAVWIAAVAIAGVSGMGLTENLSGAGWATEDADSMRVQRALDDGYLARGSTSAVLVVRDHKYTDKSARFAKRVADPFADVVGDPELDVSGSYGWHTLSGTARVPFLGAGKSTTVTKLGMDLSDKAALTVLPAKSDELAQRYRARGLDVWLVSPETFWGELNRQGVEGLVHAELIAAPVILLILFLLFRSAVASIVSVVIAGSSVIITMGLLAPLSQSIEMSIFVQNIASMLGLGVGLDYSLLMIRRFREQRAIDDDIVGALAAMMRTSGRTVAISGLTIIAAMVTLLVVDLPAIQSIAIGAITVVAVSIVNAGLVLPAILAVLGRRIDAGQVRWMRREPGSSPGVTADPTRTRWYRWSKLVTRTPWLFLGLGVAPIVLLATAAPAMNLFMPDARVLAQSDPNDVRAGFDVVNEEFGLGAASPMQIVISSPRQLYAAPESASVRTLVRRLGADDGVAEVGSAVPVLDRLVNSGVGRPGDTFSATRPAVVKRLPGDARRTIAHYVSADRRSTVIEVYSKQYAAADATEALLDRVRAYTAELPDDLAVSVGGETVVGDEAKTTVADRLPWLIVLMLVAVGVTLGLLMRSVFLPLKAIMLSLLAVGGAYGALVLVFQDGWLAGAIGLPQTNYIMFAVPVLLLAISVSLGVDYEVFVLARVREDMLAGKANSEALSVGLARTGGLVTGAALLMGAVFGAFALAGVVPVQQVGFGLAVAVVLDATIVRAVLLPAAMRLMGRWNWWPGIPRASANTRDADDGTRDEHAKTSASSTSTSS